MSAVLISLGSGVRVYCESDSSVDCKTCRNDSVYGGCCDLVRFSRRNLRGYLCDDSSGIEDESSFGYDGKSGRRAEGVVRQAENIYENVMEQHERAEKLREKYTELAKTSTHLGSRFVKAFPKMQSRRHQDLLEEIRQNLKKGRR